MEWISHGSSSSDESTYLGIFKLYSFSRISSFVTNFENFVTDFLAFKVSTISRMSLARNLLFLPTFSYFFDASIIKTSESALILFKTIIIVGIPVPKKILAGKPIIASIWFRSIKVSRIFSSSPPLNKTPCGNTIVIIPSSSK